jgi:hypothetical protein
MKLLLKSLMIVALTWSSADAQSSVQLIADFESPDDGVVAQGEQPVVDYPYVPVPFTAAR